MPSTIEWTDETWNPVTGCTKVSQGCKHCYAETIAKRFWGERDFTEVRMHSDRLDKPLRWRKPRMVFVNSMSDLFHEDVPDQFIYDILNTIRNSERHTFQILTKRPERMQEVLKPHMGRWPLRNVWLGVSVENQETADARIPLLLDTPAAVRFISYKPALGPVDLSEYLSPFYAGIRNGGVYERDDRTTLDWIICGGESGPGARPMDPAWARTVRDDCFAEDTPFFMKQMARKAPIPEDLQIREWPKAKKAPA